MWWRGPSPTLLVDRACVVLLRGTLTCAKKGVDLRHKRKQMALYKHNVHINALHTLTTIDRFVIN